MVLNSQAPRIDTPSSYRSISRLRRRRRNRRLAFVLVLCGVVAAGFYAFWPRGESGEKKEIPQGLPSAGESSAVTDTAATDRRTTPPESPVKPSAPPTVGPSTGSRVARVLDEAQRLIAADKLVEARKALTVAYVGQSQLSNADAALLRERISRVNDVLVFSPRIVGGDPYAPAYVIQPDERLSAIAPAAGVPWQFLARVNKLNPNAIPVGKRIKLVKGPFHAVVFKSAYRMDLYINDPKKPGSMYVRSFTVGLGAGDSTPVGDFIVKRGGKLENPEWPNPRNPKERYAADDPRNPIGERWIGIRGLDAQSAKHTSYGIHGTIEPDSIGRQASMGCVRMAATDVELVYDMLVEETSTVTILP